METPISGEGSKARDLDVLLVDSSSRNIFPGATSSFGDDIYNCRTFCDISHSLVQKELERISSLLGLLNMPNARTIPQVTCEIREYERVVSDKLSFCSRNTFGFIQGRSRTRDISERTRAALLDLQSMAYQTRRLSEAKESERHVRVDKICYDALAEMIYSLDAAIGLSKDTAYVYGKGDFDKKPAETDARMVAMAYLFSMYGKAKTAIATADTDFVRIMGVVPRLMGSHDFLPANQDFLDMVKSNYPVLYFFDEEGCKKIVFENLLSEGFHVNNVNGAENSLIKERIRVLWEQINSGKTEPIQIHP